MVDVRPVSAARPRASPGLLSPDPEFPESARERRGCDQREMVSCHNTGSSNFDIITVISVHNHMFIFSDGLVSLKSLSTEKAQLLCIHLGSLRFAHLFFVNYSS